MNGPHKAAARFSAGPYGHSRRSKAGPPFPGGHKTAKSRGKAPKGPAAEKKDKSIDGKKNLEPVLRKEKLLDKCIGGGDNSLYYKELGASCRLTFPPLMGSAIFLPRTPQALCRRSSQKALLKFVKAFLKYILKSLKNPVR
jgi:hypothetical protein